MAQSLEDIRSQDLFRVFSLNRWLILLAGLLFGGVTALYMGSQPDIYRATSRILIETQSPQYFRFQQNTSSPGREGRVFLLTEYEVISSRAVMSRVIESLHLDAFPPFSKSKDPVRKLKSMVAIIPVRGTKLVDIRTHGNKPELTARIVNSVADAYAKLNLERRRNLTTGGIDWIQKELVKMEDKIQDAQRKLQKFLEENTGVNFGVEQQEAVLKRIQDLNAALTGTRKSRIEAETKFREKHPKIVELQAKEQELRLALFELEQQALDANRLSIQHNALRREVKTSEQLYNLLLTRMKQLSVEEGLESNNVQVVDYALVPGRPVGPPRRSRTVSFTLLGFLVGCGLALLKEFMTQTIRTRQEFEQFLEIPFLGHIPLIQKTQMRKGAKHLLPANVTEPGFSEAIRSVRTTLEFILPSDQSHALLITSSLPEEGKSLSATNIAIALHELGRKVLLIDADLRRPNVHKLLELDLEPGLSEYLQGLAETEELIKTSPLAEGLSVISAGLTPQQPTDLLSDEKFSNQIKLWKEEYQFILIDSPPTLVAADSVILSSSVDGVLFIARANQTHREAAVAGKQRLVDVGAKIVGGVLNGAYLEHERGYRYYYAYGSYGKKKPKRQRRTRSSSRAKISDDPNIPSQETDPTGDTAQS